jgi:hypothetical protein
VSDVLICCTNAEGSQLEWLARALLDSGWSVDFMHKGSRGVASAQCVIAVWSPHSVGDAWLNARAKTAAKRRRLVSIRLGGARPPRGLRSEQVIDLSEWPARGADRAINTLLGSVDAVANGRTPRADEDRTSATWVTALVAFVIVGGGYALYRIASVPTTERGYLPAAAEHGERDSSGAAAVSSDPPTGVSDPDSDAGGVAARPQAVASDASRVGAQALDQVRALIAGGALPIADVRRAVGDALALDPDEPHARAANAVLRGLVDLQWNQAARDLAELPAKPADPALAAVVGPYRAWFGVAAVPAGVQAESSPLCEVAVDRFAQTLAAMSAEQRLQLLSSRCVIERLHGDAALRRAIGLQT